MPSSSHSSAKAACSATKPQPTQAASARAATSASRPVVVEVAALRRPRSSTWWPGRADGLVGLADEQRVAVGLGVQRDRRSAGAARDRSAPHRVDHPHGGLAPVHDRDPLERPLLARLARRVRNGASGRHRPRRAARSCGSPRGDPDVALLVDDPTSTPSSRRTRREQRAAVLGGREGGHAVDVLRQGEPAVGSDLPDAGRLEEQLDQARSHLERLRGRLVVGWKVGREEAHDRAVALPGALEDLVGGTVEVDAVDRVGSTASAVVSVRLPRPPGPLGARG